MKIKIRTLLQCVGGEASGSGRGRLDPGRLHPRGPRCGSAPTSLESPPVGRRGAVDWIRGDERTRTLIRMNIFFFETNIHLTIILNLPLITKKLLIRNCHEFLIHLILEVLGGVGRHYDTYGPTDHRHRGKDRANGGGCACLGVHKVESWECKYGENLSIITIFLGVH